MNARISLLLVIGLLFAVSVSAEYTVQLGDGCGGVDSTVYDASCQLVCDGNKVVEECTVVHGWCSSGNSCVPCDFKEVTTTTDIETCTTKIEPAYTSCFDGKKTEVEFSYSCEEKGKSAACTPTERTVIESTLPQDQTCQEKDWGFDFDGDGSYDGIGITNVPLERGYVPPAEETDCTAPQWIPIYCDREYWIDSAQSEPDKDSYDFFINGNTQYCEDADNDGFTSLCGPSNIGEVKPAYQTIFSEYECADGTPMDEYWKDDDGDGKWEDYIFACDPPSGYDPLPTNADLETENYDCNPTSDNNIFPEGCFCNSGELGKSYVNQEKTFSCLLTSGQTTLSDGAALTTIQLTRRITPQRWVESQEQTGGLLGDVSCPQGFCGISENLADSSSNQCVPIGTLATLTGKVNSGDLVCEGTDEGTQWISRTNKLAGLFTQMGELSGKDYTVYCDSLDAIVHNYTKAGTEANPNDGSREYLAKLSTSSATLGQGCILVIGQGAGGDYASQTKQATRPAPFSQKVVFGFATTQTPSEIFSVDLNDPVQGDEWTETNGIMISHPKKIAIILQSSKDPSASGPIVDAELQSLFSQATTPNSFIYTLFRFFRSPLSIFTTQAMPLPTILDKVYLSKHGDFYWQSAVVQDTLYMKIANAPEELKDHLKQKVCETSDCVKDGDTLGITLPASEFNAWSRPLRLQEGATNPGYDFFGATCDPEVQIESQCNNPPGTCFESNGMCSSLGFCEYVEVPVGLIDSCCPTGATEETDFDCATESQGEFACNDGVDNDRDGLIDMADAGCTDEDDNNEANLEELPLNAPTTCEGTELFYLNSIAETPDALKNVHANQEKSAVSNNPSICTPASLNTLWQTGTSCPIGYGKVITLLSEKNAQVEFRTSGNTISGARTLCAKNTNGPVSCSLESASASCGSVVRLSGETNAHITASEQSSLTLYPKRLCCEYQEAGMVVSLSKTTTGNNVNFACVFEGGAELHRVTMDYDDRTTPTTINNVNTNGQEVTQTFQHTYTPGTYTASCTVRDGNNIDQVATTQVTIN